MIYLLLIPLAILSGILGRMGGKGRPYNTTYRDCGCSVIAMIASIIVFPSSLAFWWVYPLILILHWIMFSTYWDWLFGGVDNLWFSGFMVGMAIGPIVCIDYGLWWVVLLRAVVLCVIWGCLNKYLPQIKGRDVVEEFSRYTVSL